MAAGGMYPSARNRILNGRISLANAGAKRQHRVRKEELAQIYVKRGLEPPLARPLTLAADGEDALTAHARMSWGISGHNHSPSCQAALTSAATFSVGAAYPCLWSSYRPAGACPNSVRCVFGVSCASGGEQSGWRECFAGYRPSCFGGIAMALTAGIGKLVSTVV
jgi:VIT1/CCC1 family predicted Fe2+/Mn2+ transporter